jgi:hypothetical protein
MLADQGTAGRKAESSAWAGHGERVIDHRCMVCLLLSAARYIDDPAGDMHDRQHRPQLLLLRLHECACALLPFLALLVPPAYVGVRTNGNDRRELTSTESLICPGWETFVVPIFQPEPPNRD